MLYHRILAESKRLESEINSIKKQISKFPDKKIFCSKNSNRYKWYITDGKTQTYLPKSQRVLAEKLATRKYLSNLLEDLMHEKTAIDFYLRLHNPIRKSEQMLIQTPEYRNLIEPYFTPHSDELHQWASTPSSENPCHTEQLIFKATSGKFVRSKSEVIIDMFLHTHRLPFRYEAPLILGSVTIYPDFTIRHPNTGNFFYWEHFGLADDPSYRKNMNSKLQLYTSYGIYPTIQLITTYETKDSPLNTELVENIIQYYFS